MRIVRHAALLVTLVTVLIVPGARAQVAVSSGDVYRVFLRDGQALASYGEPVHVADRVVFNLVITGADGQASLQLLSLPETTVDLAHTDRYAEAMRAARYAATRGEADYAAMSEEVARALGQLRAIQDAGQRRALAGVARQRLLDWSAGHYGYRAHDIEEFASLFDGIAEDVHLRPGETSLSLDLVAGPPAPAREPLRPAPDLPESIEMALAAVAHSDSADERRVLLHAAGELAASAPEGRDALIARVEAETRIESDYVSLAADLGARADSDRRRGDVAGLTRRIAEFDRRDRDLGSARPDVARAVRGRLAAALESARTYRLALDHYQFVKPRLLGYERGVRPVLAGLEAAAPMLGAIRDLRTVAYADIQRWAARLTRLDDRLGALDVPEELGGVHATIAGAIALARQACARRGEAVATNKLDTAREASSAAAGALLLAGAVRMDLVTALFPPAAP
jgi:hypothetical protein